MSFSSDVKEELSGKISPARHCRIAETAAMISLCGRLQRGGEDGAGFKVQTENLSVARKYFTLLRKTFNIEVDISIRQSSGNHQNRTYAIGIPGRRDAERVLESCKLPALEESGPEALAPVQSVVTQNLCCKRAFLRGAFLAAGSISDPKRFYHFEIACLSGDKAEQIRDLMLSFDLEPRIVRRKKYDVVYIKEGDQIVDILNVMEAPMSLMQLENIRILKEMRGSVNRKVNCETANINKTVSAAVRQMEDIRYIQDTVGIGSLPDNLREIAQLRLQYPEATLKELGDALNPPVGKSGVNHRLRKLGVIADSLREKKPEME
ncbi:MAG: DNA-binding protein WhiA [Clostridiales bacterium]|nr:DNA-binding protein WhiA [Clostridiales bacterium]